MVEGQVRALATPLCFRSPSGPVFRKMSISMSAPATTIVKVLALFVILSARFADARYLITAHVKYRY